ncbi:MAG TPA: hypothetical protein VF269_03555 [Rhodanobacteraceae bacterium]
MKWLHHVWQAIAGLFVDDRWLAIATLLWLLIAWWLLPRLAVPLTWQGVILFLGIAAILVWTSLRHGKSP